MLETFQEHTLDTTLLKHGCTVLDIGCRGFAFGDDLRKRFRARVYEVDIDDLGPSTPYYRCGIAASDGFGSVKHHPDPSARTLIAGTTVPVYTIESFSQRVGVETWDVIKLDCEGSEYEILWQLQRPPATQLTVEFHQHTDARRSEDFMAALIRKLEQWYKVKRHRLYGLGPASLNYWDSLFVLR
jgi:hypothetical protein